MQDDRFFAVAQPGDNVTYVAIARPRPGTWTVTPVPGSSVTSIRTAGALPKPSVKGKIRKGRLVYRVAPIPGQTVRFLEVGKQVSAELGTTRRTAGSLRVGRASGPGGSRRIVAIVEQNGLARARLTVARYTASSKPLAAPRVVVKRSGTKALVAWTPIPGASGYRVVVTLNGRGCSRPSGSASGA